MQLHLLQLILQDLLLEEHILYALFHKGASPLASDSNKPRARTVPPRRKAGSDWSVPFPATFHPAQHFHTSPRVGHCLVNDVVGDEVGIALAREEHIPGRPGFLQNHAAIDLGILEYPRANQGVDDIPWLMHRSCDMSCHAMHACMQPNWLGNKQQAAQLARQQTASSPTGSIAYTCLYAWGEHMLLKKMQQVSQPAPQEISKRTTCCKKLVFSRRHEPLQADRFLAGNPCMPCFSEN